MIARLSYQADLTAGFPAYLRDLHQSTRRSIWNLRRRLQEFGPVRLEDLPAQEIASGFRDLNRLHELRWQKPAFGVRRLQFHTALAQRLAERGELALSRLWVGGQVVSVLYDIRKGARQYNIKMAFDPGLQPAGLPRTAASGLRHGGGRRASGSAAMTFWRDRVAPAISSDC